MERRAMGGSVAAAAAATPPPLAKSHFTAGCAATLPAPVIYMEAAQRGRLCRQKQLPRLPRSPSHCDAC